MITRSLLTPTTNQTDATPVRQAQPFYLMRLFLIWTLAIFACLSNAAQAQTNNAQFVSQTVPATMIAGQSYQIPVTMTNKGSTTWNSAGSYGGYKLGIPNTANANWGINRVVLGTTTVAPGQSQTFTLNVTAPKTTGTYNFQWQMVQENVAWFGALTTNVAVNVVNSQTITFNALSAQTMGASPVALSATASSGLAVAFTSATPTTCTVSGTSVTLVAAGTCTINANQAGNTSYAAAPTVPQSFTINATTPTNNAQFVSQTVPATMIAGQSYQIPVTMTNNGSTTWNSAGSYGGYKLGIPNSANANWGINRVVLGTTTVAPGQSQTFTLNVTAPKTTGTYNFQWQMVQENVAWFGALTTNVSVNVVNSQTISFTAPANQIYYSAPVTLNGSASSGLAISYTVAASSAGICSVTGNTVTLGNAGTCTITASQSGNAGYAAAPAVTVAFSVTPHSQALTIPNPNTKTLGTAPFTVSATSSVGMTPVILSSLTTSICTVSGNTVTLVAPGTCTLAANQAGNIDYSAAPQATQSFSVTSPLSVALTSPTAGQTLTAPASLILTATATDSAGPIKQVAFYNGASLMGTVTQAPYSITIPDTSAGTYTITAQATDSLGNSATSSPVTMTVNPPLTIGPWVAKTMPLSGSYNSIAYGNGGFVAISSIGNSTVAYSTDNGATWSASSLPTGSTSQLQYGNGLFVTLNPDSSTAYTSADGATWTARSLPATANWMSLVYGNGLFVAVAAGTTTILTSPDGINWTAGSLPISQSGSSIAFGNHLFAIVGSQSNIAMVSPDAVNWTQHTLPTSLNWNAITYGNGQFVVVSGNGSGLTSPDGVNWTTQGMLGVSGSAIAYGDGLFVFIPSSSNSTTAPTSPDGINWSSSTLPAPMFWNSVAYGNNTFIAVGGTNTTECAVMGVETVPPAVSITGPTSAQHFMAPANVNLTATASSNSGIAQVQYFNGSTLIGTATQSPYTVAWNNLAAGSYSLTAVATDNDGVTVTSAPFTLTIEAPLSISIINPLSGSQMTAGNLTLSANPVETNGTITQVAFYNGSTLMGTVTQLPYSLEFKNAALGNYTITAKVTDSEGFTATSASVTFAVVAESTGTGTGSGSSGNETVYDIHTDQLNAPRLISNQSGNAVWQWNNTDPFGDNLPNQDPNNSGTQFIFNLRFAGQYADIETGLFYNYFRDYDPLTGRYVESDLIGLFGGSLSTYAYTHERPLSSKDSKGLDDICDPFGDCYTPALSR